MTRSIWHCLALCAFLASPPVASGQTMVGQSRLAPVALEARCRFADSMIHGPTYLVAMGRDPLHAAILAEDLSRQPEHVDATTKPGDSEVAVQNQYCEPFPPPKPFCPFEELALEEPLDIEFESEPLASAETTDVSLTETVHTDAISEIAASAPVDDGIVTAGASPTIVLLDQADLPQDFSFARPIRITLRPNFGPLACELPRPPLQLATTPEVELADLLPTAEQIEKAKRAFAGMVPATPLECWLDEIVWNVESALALDGPIRPWLDMRKLGQSVVDISDIAVHTASDTMRPALPVLAQVVDPAPVDHSTGDLAIAADVLHSAALELEKLAHQLRTWGDDLHRVAAADDSIQRR